MNTVPVEEHGSPVSLADALEEAQQRIQQLLQHPDDLQLKLTQMKHRFTTEKASIDAILKTSVQQQLDDTQSGLRLLKSCADGVHAMQQHLGNIDSACVDQRGAISNYPKIKLVSRTHQNFIATKMVVKQFQDLNRDIDRISAMLDEDEVDPMRDGSKNLLNIHHQLFQLESFREETLLKARSQGPSVLQIVTKYFKHLDGIVYRFRQHLWALAARALDLIRADQGSLIVRMVQIVEREEHDDEQVLVTQQVRTSNPQLAGSGAFKTLAENPRTMKNFRSQLFNAIHESIEVQFTQHTASHDNDIGASLNAVQDFVYDDLGMVYNELVPRFPRKYQIFSFYVIQYHKRVYDLLNRLTTDGRSLETRDILQLTTWVREYYRIMSERFGVGEELLEPRLLDDNEAILIGNYVKLIRQKLMEWVDRLLETERMEFITRDKPPETEDENIYCTSAAVILFQMINQQVDIAVDASRGGLLLLDVARECFDIARYFSTQQIKMLELEEQKFDQNADDFQPGFPEYVIALSNNHFKCSEFVEVLQQRLEATLDEKHRAEASKIAADTIDTFSKSSKRGTACLLHIVLRDVGPVFHQICTASWYEEAKMSLIVGTLDDYLQDFKLHLHDYLFSKLSTDCMDRFISSYIDALRTPPSTLKSPSVTKFKIPAAAVRIKSDVQVAVEFWSKFKTAKRVKQAFDIIDKLVGLLECSDGMIFLSWYSIAKVYNDVPMQFVEEMLLRRDDFSKAIVKEAMQNCRSKAKEPGALGNSEATASVFSKMTTAHEHHK